MTKSYAHVWPEICCIYHKPHWQGGTFGLVWHRYMNTTYTYAQKSTKKSILICQIRKQKLKYRSTSCQKNQSHLSKTTLAFNRITCFCSTVTFWVLDPRTSPTSALPSLNGLALSLAMWVLFYSDISFTIFACLNHFMSTVWTHDRLLVFYFNKNQLIYIVAINKVNVNLFYIQIQLISRYCLTSVQISQINSISIILLFPPLRLWRPLFFVQSFNDVESVKLKLKYNKQYNYNMYNCNLPCTLCNINYITLDARKTMTAL